MDWFLRNNRLPAYTILEIAVALVIGSFVIGGIYVFYSHIMKSTQELVKIVNESGESNSVIAIFERDFMNCRSVTIDIDSSIVLTISNTEVIYNFDSLVERKIGNHVDYIASDFDILSISYRDSQKRIDTITLRRKNSIYKLIKRYSCENLIYQDADPSR
ncbi:MAG: hypothetical protein WEC59_00305 [Salibacteraceae bacterium]